jgi:phage gpG-like protein
MTLISSTLLGIEGLQQQLQTILDRASDLRPFWTDEFAPPYFAEIQDGFAVGGRQRDELGRFIGGTAWAPLSKRYKEWKQKAYPGQGILQRTGRLQESLKWDGSGLGPEGIFNAFPDHVETGTAVPYGRYLQDGIPDRMPARPFMWPPDPTEYEPMLLAWLVRGL